MRKFIAALLLPLALAACGVLDPRPAGPVVVADQTVLDERAAVGVELAYKATALTLETAVDAGLLYGEAATKAAELDRKAYAAVTAARKAYEAGNAATYDQAVADAYAAVSLALEALR